ncbi:hypothetical protein ACAG39_05240 [Caldicellulosiruptoraceae bacterium PP1]
MKKYLSALVIMYMCLFTIIAYGSSQFSIDKNGYLIKTTGKSYIRSKIKFEKFIDKNPKYLLAAGKDKSLYIVSKDILKERKIASPNKNDIYYLSTGKNNAIDWLYLTYYNGLYYFIDNGYIKFTNGTKETIIGDKNLKISYKSMSFTFQNKIIYFKSKNGNNDFSFQEHKLYQLDLKTNKEKIITYGNKDVHIKILFLSPNTQFYIRYDDKKKISEYHLRKDDFDSILFTNNDVIDNYWPDLTSVDNQQYVSQLLLKRGNLFFYMPINKTYIFIPDSTFIKLFDKSFIDIYLINNKLYVAKTIFENNIPYHIPAGSEIGYYDLATGEYKRVLNKYGDNVHYPSGNIYCIDSVDNEGNIVFTEMWDEGMSHYGYKKYKYIANKKTITVLSFQPGREEMYSKDDIQKVLKEVYNQDYLLWSSKIADIIERESKLESIYIIDNKIYIAKKDNTLQTIIGYYDMSDNNNFNLVLKKQEGNFNNNGQIYIEKVDENGNIYFKDNQYDSNYILSSYIKYIYIQDKNILQIVDIWTKDNNVELIKKYKGKTIKADEFIDISEMLKE